MPASCMARYTCYILAALLVCAGESHGGADEPDNDGDRVYRYVVDGVPVYVNDLASVPDEHRDAVEVIMGEQLLDIYRYKVPGGRVAYTNDRFRIPPRQRDQAEIVDLSHISLNSELAEDLARAIDTSYATALDTDVCRDARGAAGMGWLRGAWHRHGGVLALGAVALVLLLLTPFALRRVEAAIWAKVLSTSFMVLALVGVFTYLTGETARHLDQLKIEAEPCMHDGNPSSVGSLATARSRAGVIQTLRQRIAERNAALEAVMNIE